MLKTIIPHEKTIPPPKFRSLLFFQGQVSKYTITMNSTWVFAYVTCARGLGFFSSKQCYCSFVRRRTHVKNLPNRFACVLRSLKSSEKCRHGKCMEVVGGRWIHERLLMFYGWGMLFMDGLVGRFVLRKLQI